MNKVNKGISIILIEKGDFVNLERRLENIIANKYIKETFVVTNKNKKIDYKNLKKKYSEQKIIFIFENLSIPELLNKLIFDLKSEFFIILDNNEFFYQTNLSLFIEKYLNDDEINLIYTNSILKDSLDNFLGFCETLLPHRFLENVNHINEITLGSFLLRKGLFKKIGFFNKKFKKNYLLDFIIRAFKSDLKSIRYASEVNIIKYIYEFNSNKFINFENNIELLEIYISHNFKLDSISRRIINSLASLNDNEIKLILDKNNYSDLTVNKLNLLREELNNSYKDLDNSEYLRTLPNDLKIILESRLDLQKQGFNLSLNERKFCQWLIKFGLKEYPPLRDDNSLGSALYWLRSNRDGEAISRMYLAIFDSNKILRKVFKLIKSRNFRINFIRFLWPFLPYNLPSFKFYNGFDDKFLFLKNIKSINSLNAKGNLNYPPEGVNLIGYAKHALGIGEDLRSTFFALDQVKISTSIINFPPGSFKGREENSLRNKIKNVHIYNTTILCLTAEESLRYFMKLGTLEFENKYIIGYWPWELPIWPKNWESAIEYVNEIWVSSKHIKNSLKDVTDKPVKLMPLCIDQPNFKIRQQNLNKRITQRKRFNLEKNSIYLCFSFDQNSYIERKNPWDALRAFQMAFPPVSQEDFNNQVKLLIKTFPNKNSSYQWEKLKRIAAMDHRIIILEKNMSRIDLLDLYGCCDIFISLHRAEGYGRCLAEALQLGLDLVATNWSGNTDFCTGPLYHPVPFKIEKVKPFDYPYWQNQYWAQPDLIKAADILKKVVKRRIEKGLPEIEISQNYQNYFAANKCGLRYKKRLEELNLINATPKFL